MKQYLELLQHVLENGAICESGTFEDLMQKGGLFTSMMSKQQAG